MPLFLPRRRNNAKPGASRAETQHNCDPPRRRLRLLKRPHNLRSDRPYGDAAHRSNSHNRRTEYQWILALLRGNALFCTRDPVVDALGVVESHPKLAERVIEVCTGLARLDEPELTFGRWRLPALVALLTHRQFPFSPCCGM